MEYDEFSAMGTTVLAAAEGDPQPLTAGFAAVRHWVADSEARFSRFRPDSELCQLNRAAGQWFTASNGLYELVETALELHQLTGGLFDPSILPALLQAGYDRSLDDIHRAGDQPLPPAHAMSLDSGPAHTAGLSETALDPERQAIRLPAGIQIDLGGIAKGWIAERAAGLLSTFSPACAVDAGGDIALRGIPSDFPEAAPAGPANHGWSWVDYPLSGPRLGMHQPAGWRIALEDPRDPQQTLAVLRVGAGTVVTSSITRRRWTQAGQPRHHMIDPRTGQPAEPAWLSVTVFARQAAWAEAFAKAILLAGPDRALDLARRVPELRFIAVIPDGSLWGAPESMEMIDEPEPSL